jgi:hypothetical protein
MWTLRWPRCGDTDWGATQVQIRGQTRLRYLLLRLGYCCENKLCPNDSAHMSSSYFILNISKRRQRGRLSANLFLTRPIQCIGLICPGEFNGLSLSFIKREMPVLASAW